MAQRHPSRRIQGETNCNDESPKRRDYVLIPQICMHTGAWSKTRTTKKKCLWLYHPSQGKQLTTTSLSTAVPIAAPESGASQLRVPAARSHHSSRRSPPVHIEKRRQWRLPTVTCRSSVWAAWPVLPLPVANGRPWRWARVHDGPSLMYAARMWCREAWWWPAASCALSAGT